MKDIDGSLYTYLIWLDLRQSSLDPTNTELTGRITFPALAEVAKETGHERADIYQALINLEAKGEIEIMREGNESYIILRGPTITRINKHGVYGPGNTRWARRSERLATEQGGTY